ncbi:MULTISPECIES: MFS transporter [unclassified Brevibacterium]|uniref:MFS transporter n=1 Tax=unclassified Brevibacterium TaxID=2614124 RepID=UPI001E2D031A|nr:MULTISPECIES: MFS transporter [unclassified Brevibacterium]MCD1286318.1 MFS transporter [Brevibacterium sp. CCUG 69071]MDK8433681.1 MFS transporter [Brevibacterium sp. H-BE7]
MRTEAQHHETGHRSRRPSGASSLNRRRLALLALFFLPGISIASWVTRTPSIRDSLDASTAQMGLVLFGLSIGSMIGILGSGPLVSRWGARPVIVVGTIGVVASMPIVGLGAAVSQPLVVAAGLVVFGLGMGTGEVAMNVEGAELEKHLGSPFLPALHGFFSLGTVIGAVLGIVATAADFSVLIHLVAIGVLGAIVLVPAMRHVPAGTGRTDAATTSADASASAHGDRNPTAASAVSGSRARPVWRDPRLIVIGAIVLGMALAEGTANDWLPLVMVDGHGFDAALGSSIYAIFAASMTLGRFLGGPIVARFGRPNVLLVSGAFGLVGIGLTSLIDSQIVAAVAVILWGLGTSLGFPVALSEAGASGPNPAKRVATVSTIGYLAFLVGPPALGLVGEHWGLRSALLIPMGVLVLVVALAPVLRRRHRARRPREPQSPR